MVKPDRVVMRSNTKIPEASSNVNTARQSKSRRSIGYNRTVQCVLQFICTSVLEVTSSYTWLTLQRPSLSSDRLLSLQRMCICCSSILDGLESNWMHCLQGFGVLLSDMHETIARLNSSDLEGLQQSLSCLILACNPRNLGMCGAPSGSSDVLTSQQSSKIESSQPYSSWMTRTALLPFHRNRRSFFGFS
jgi:hypothetical protein